MSAVLLNYRSLKVHQVANEVVQVNFPYVPGLLAFREAPGLVMAVRRLSTKPDVCIVDGHGVAHPRRSGLACHVGVSLNLPTVGVAKRKLFGVEKDGVVYDADGNKIAATLTSTGKKLYVSVGHKISLREAVRIVKHCITENGLEPIRRAHEEATRTRWQMTR